MKVTYISPSILKQVTVQPENNLLAASLAEKVSGVESKGQDVVMHDATGVTFNHTWED